MESPPGYPIDRSKPPFEIRQNFPISMSYEEFYGITVTGPPPGFEEKKEIPNPAPVTEKKVEEPLPHIPPKEKSEEDAWVTVKPKLRKKVLNEAPSSIKSSAPQQVFESLAEIQLSSNKANKKKVLKKKLKEIKELQKKQMDGEKLDPQQLQKVQNKEKLERELFALN
jgi:hypothetical protein